MSSELTLREIQLESYKILKYFNEKCDELGLENVLVYKLSHKGTAFHDIFPSEKTCFIT